MAGRARAMRRAAARKRASGNAAQRKGRPKAALPVSCEKLQRRSALAVAILLRTAGVALLAIALLSALLLLLPVGLLLALAFLVAAGLVLAALVLIGHLLTPLTSP